MRGLFKQCTCGVSSPGRCLLILSATLLALQESLPPLELAHNVQLPFCTSVRKNLPSSADIVQHREARRLSQATSYCMMPHKCLFMFIMMHVIFCAESSGIFTCRHRESSCPAVRRPNCLQNCHQFHFQCYAVPTGGRSKQGRLSKRW
ncbi:uncharacterized protein LOC142577908 isoform X2 [Dermacentor variabilis]|uniref:uncharacterized protein LOC142577908 isoform X2 n=1 Tax=Dermacentor variabilis TaxID=34621 RepID=UPI003F5B05AE